MTRDEILAAIEQLSTREPMTVFGLSEAMREVARLTDAYPDHADGASLAQALTDAMERFADHALVLSL